MDAMVHWISQHQPGTALRVHETEVNGAVAMTQIGISVSKLTSGLSKEKMVLKQTEWGVSLSLLHRLGLNFLQIPEVLQVQPYI